MLMYRRCWVATRQHLCSHLLVFNKDVPFPLCCPPSTLNDIDSVADGVKGVLTGTSNFLATHMLFADDLSLMSNDPNHMLKKPRVFSQKEIER